MLSARCAFTIKELLVVIVVIGAGLAFCSMGIMESKEASLRVQCVNNLKQIGLGIQNFHDIRQECVLGYLTTDANDRLPTGHLTWPALLLDYCEQSSMFKTWTLNSALEAENLVFGQPDMIPGNRPPQQASYPWLFCPSRRTPPQHCRFGGNPNVIGAVGDYAAVAYGEATADFTLKQLGRPLDWDGALMCSRAVNLSNRSTQMDSTVQLGPGDYRSMTNWGDVIDGLSYTAFIGEKALRRGCEGNRSQALANVDQDGCVYYAGGGTTTQPLPEPLAKSRYQPGRAANCMRSLGRFSAGSFPAPSAGAAAASASSLPQLPSEEDPNFRFGSWHNGITMFVLGDGGVRSVNNAAAEKPLQRLATRNDGCKQIDLP